jgi:hypothetical protein
MPETLATRVVAPLGTMNVVEEVRQLVGDATDFKTYHLVLKELWPKLNESSPNACLDLAFDVYVEIMSQRGVMIEEQLLRIAR